MDPTDKDYWTNLYEADDPEFWDEYEQYMHELLNEDNDGDDDAGVV